MYFEISIAAFAVVTFLTLRDIRIFRRTRLFSYRKGALRGMAAMFIVLVGSIIIQINVNLGLLLVLIGMFINKKGQRDVVFREAGTFDRFLGRTDL